MMSRKRKVLKRKQFSYVSFKQKKIYPLFRTINEEYFSGRYSCPSSEELSSIWTLVVDIPSISGSTCEQELGSMSINDNSNKSSWVPLENQNVTGSGQVNDLPGKDKPSVGASCKSRVMDHPDGPSSQCLPKFYCPGTRCPSLCEDNMYPDFDMDEVDLNLENYDELFGMTLTHSEELFENGGFDSLFGTKDISAEDSDCLGAAAAEGLQPTCSNAESADSILSTKTEPIICFTARQAPSNLSFSGTAGETNAGDYQDCGASSMLLIGEPPRSDNFLRSAANRSNAVMHYKEKKKIRMFDKRVRYASRKERVMSESA